MCISLPISEVNISPGVRACNQLNSEECLLKTGNFCFAQEEDGAYVVRLPGGQ